MSAIAMVRELPPRTWRDAITPASRASRRRWTLAYALLLLFALYYWGTTDLREDGAGLLVVVSLFVVFGMLRRGTRRLTAIDHPGLDERDMYARDRAFRLAYPLLLLVLLGAVAVLAFGLPGIDHTTRVTREGGFVFRDMEHGLFLNVRALIGLALWVALWAVFLPTGVLAWREPDAIDPDPAQRPFGVSEPVRDALLGAALVGGLAIGLLLDDAQGLALLPLIGVLMLLGALARRAAGQPAVQPNTIWHYVIGLGLIAVVIAVLYFTVGRGAGP